MTVRTKVYERMSKLKIQSLIKLSERANESQQRKQKTDELKLFLIDFVCVNNKQIIVFL